MRLAQRLLLYAVLIVVFLAVTVLATVEQASWRDLLPAALATLVVAFVMALLFSRSVSRPLLELRDVTRSLAEGNLASRPALSAPGEVGDLATAVNRLAEQLGARIVALQTEDALLAALIESLNEGVIAIDSRQQVVRINHVGRQILRVKDEVPFTVDRLPRDRLLHLAIQDALKGVSTDLSELTIGDHVLSLTGRPLLGGGAVLAFFDLTQIRKLETVRRDFVANVSHELRTPLTIVGGFAETLAEDDLPTERRRQFAEMIRTNTSRMQRLVDDLLDLSRIESGGWIPNPTAVDVSALASEVIAGLQRSLQGKKVVVKTAVNADATTVYADRTALRQVLSNLAENAVRHTAEGRVIIFTEPADGGVRVGVSDTGAGISNEHLPRIFERFYRVDTGRARESGGTGLGLAIVKHLVEAHGGRVEASSVVGQGTTIAAFLPRPSSMES